MALPEGKNDVQEKKTSTHSSKWRIKLKISIVQSTMSMSDSIFFPMFSFLLSVFSKECNFSCLLFYAYAWLNCERCYFQRVWTIHSISSFKLLKQQKIQCQNIKEINRYDCWPLQPRWRSTKNDANFFYTFFKRLKIQLQFSFPPALALNDVIDCTTLGIMYTNRMICSFLRQLNVAINNG